jgi:hypothetical protein
LLYETQIAGLIWVHESEFRASASHCCFLAMHDAGKKLTLQNEV